nr:WD repeat-containing protein 6 isoform X1 [Leptinotarsa decemlineata]
MFCYKSQFIKTNVTAIKTVKNFILLGIGTTLHVYHKNETLLFYKLDIPNTRGENIHGIEYFQNIILIYGGQFMTLLKVNEDFTTFDKTANTALLDWVLDAKWINNGKNIVAVSLQNKLYIWDSELNSKKVVDCEEKCILYSAHICYEKYEDLTILSGTVFSEILIWKPSRQKNGISVVLKRLQRHNGVIFSIHHNENAGFICSSSDDRTAVLWKINNKSLLVELEQEVIDITPQCRVSGHSSRIFSCRVLNNHFVTAGEDSLLNIWSFDGKPVKKFETHQCGPIWSLDWDEEENRIVTGGGDGGVSTFSIDFNAEQEKLMLPDGENPKIVGILQSFNLVIFSEGGVLYLYIKSQRKYRKIVDHEDLKRYAVMQVSRCRKMIALAGIKGQIYVYKEHHDTLHLVSSAKTNDQSRIASLHWLTCKSFLICQANGKMTLLHHHQMSLKPASTFILPPSSERWSTTATIFNDNIIVGDRRGNIHLYEIGKSNPLQTLRKAHSHLGVTKLIIQQDNIISLGRNAIVKHFSLNSNGLELVSCNKLPFTWLLDIFGSTLIAFSSKNFIVWDCNSERVLFETSCGGGHRSWDFFKATNGLMFVYVKDKMICEVWLDVRCCMPNNLIEGFHSKEINSVTMFKGLCEYILVSGGEDTKLRISSIRQNGTLFKTHVALKSHLSSIRSIAVYKFEGDLKSGKETYLLFSAGGRAQIMCWKLDCFFDDDSLQNLICSQQCSYYNTIDAEESETRIMKLCVADTIKAVVLFAACSDGNIQVFHVEHNNFNLKFCKNMFYALKCIISVAHMNVLNEDVLISMATDGKLVFWNVTNVFDSTECVPFESLPAHQSGINTFAMRELKNYCFLLLTGGDDNSIILNYVKFSRAGNNLILNRIDEYVNVGSHWAQITGSFLNEKHFMTSSVDQRLVVFRWRIEDEKIICECISKYNTPVTDLKGLICFENCDLDVFLYGNGIEFVKVVEELNRF